MKGQIVEWNDKKGYGFISALNGELIAFIHVSSVKNINRRPKLNDAVTFDIVETEKGRFNAENVEILGLGGFPMNVLFATTFLVFASGSVLVLDGEVILIPLYLALSLLTYLMYAWDKQAALDGKRRTPENTLHILSLIGGWPGALLAQFLLRHKSRKQPFKFVLWVTIVMNICMFIWLFTDSGRNLVQSVLNSI
ncbi:DUF1294 domain-containing protein [Vibrio hannami]|uniref:DUF1294 domain-containing protein n=1 Tax=Vibrio hannami TaxID=2717094 RepID=UPI00240EDC45|nr:DUF1294 domain-containing protein [Vibrio hannami]MDG3085962.1 DUF1294 domain-containing protein [Vibrio hannami]